ncbi:hypothetical protein, partial [Burkholderia multivorans]|uniref:hypothetical protein n=1 Tax=Burkholderia multivorans TaxID=87883 RepID=UPI000A847AD7
MRRLKLTVSAVSGTERALPAALTELQDVVSIIEADQRELEGRLYPVLEPDDIDEEGCDKPQADEEAETRLVYIVRGITRRLHVIREQQRDILD